jgi:GT2 family glycosyltransferase
MCQDCAMVDVPGFDVVIVTYNHGETIHACLTAVSALDTRPRSVIVVDNSSDDDTLQHIEDFSDVLSIQTVKNNVNAGFAAGANSGIAKTSSEWVLLLNPDCAPQPDYCRELLLAAASHEGQARIGSMTGLIMRSQGSELLPTDTVDAAGMVVNPSGRHFDRGAGKSVHSGLLSPASVFGGTGAATLYLRSALDDVKYPDGQIFAESFFAYREDAELAWRLQWRGWSCLYWPKARASHQRGFRPERGRRGHEIINFHSVKNRFLLRWHCADLAWHLRFFPAWFVRDLLVLGACLTIERSSLPALRMAWRQRRDASARRRHVLSTGLCDSRHLRRWFRRGEWVEEVEV